jgi:dTDP-glucose 4,6-dehydratase
MRHVITGGSGFTGTYLVRALAQAGQRPVVFDLQPPAENADQVDFVAGDIRAPADVARIGLRPGDVVHHFAARQFHGGVPKRDRDPWFADVNVGGTRVLLDEMTRTGASRMVFFSTDMTYGHPDRSPVPADHPQRPIGPYGLSKKAAEALIRERPEIRATILRPRLISGAGRLGILAKLFRLIAIGAPVPMIGSGRNRYQMIAVEDCVAAALRAAELDCPTGPFNLGSENPPSVRDLLGEVIRRAGSRSILVPTPAKLVQTVLSGLDKVGLTLLFPEQFAIADTDYVLDTSRTRDALGWIPTRRDQDILFEAYERFRQPHSA